MTNRVFDWFLSWFLTLDRSQRPIYLINSETLVAWKHGNNCSSIILIYHSHNFDSPSLTLVHTDSQLLRFLCMLIPTESKSCLIFFCVYSFPNRDTFLGFMFHLVSVLGTISRWDFSASMSKTLLLSKYFGIWYMKNYRKQPHTVIFFYITNIYTVYKNVKINTPKLLNLSHYLNIAD